MADKKSFLFNLNWVEVLGDYEAEVRHEVYDAIIEYARSGTLIDLKPLAKMAFSFIKREMDFNSERYADTVEKRKEAGSKGGRPRKTNEEEDDSDEEKAKKANGFSEKQTKAKKANGFSEKLYDNDNDNDNDYDYSDSSLSSESSSAPPADEQQPSIPQFIEFWNKTMDDHGAIIPRLSKIEGKRKAGLMARCREYGKRKLSEMVVKLAKSDFCNGRSERPFVANFDWAIRPNNFPKVVDGNYDNRETTERGADRMNSNITNFNNEETHYERF